MFKEFKEFAMKGNLVDLAVGFILGGAFSTIVKSLVNDIMMPPLGLLLGGVDFADLIRSTASPMNRWKPPMKRAHLSLPMACSSTMSFPS